MGVIGAIEGIFHDSLQVISSRVSCLHVILTVKVLVTTIDALGHF